MNPFSTSNSSLEALWQMEEKAADLEAEISVLTAAAKRGMERRAKLRREAARPAWVEEEVAEAAAAAGADGQYCVSEEETQAKFVRDHVYAVLRYEGKMSSEEAAEFAATVPQQVISSAEVPLLEDDEGSEDGLPDAFGEDEEGCSPVMKSSARVSGRVSFGPRPPMLTATPVRNGPFQGPPRWSAERVENKLAAERAAVGEAEEAAQAQYVRDHIVSELLFEGKSWAEAEAFADSLEQQVLTSADMPPAPTEEEEALADAADARAQAAYVHDHVVATLLAEGKSRREAEEFAAALHQQVLTSAEAEAAEEAEAVEKAAAAARAQAEYVHNHVVQTLMAEGKSRREAEDFASALHQQVLTSADVQAQPTEAEAAAAAAADARAHAEFVRAHVEAELRREGRSAAEAAEFAASVPQQVISSAEVPLLAAEGGMLGDDSEEGGDDDSMSGSSSSSSEEGSTDSYEEDSSEFDDVPRNPADFDGATDSASDDADLDAMVEIKAQYDEMMKAQRARQGDDDYDFVDEGEPIDVAKMLDTLALVQNMQPRSGTPLAAAPQPQPTIRAPAAAPAAASDLSVPGRRAHQAAAMRTGRALLLRSVLQNYYAKHAPDGLDRVDELVARVVGGAPTSVGGLVVGGALWTEAELFAKIEAKYGHPVDLDPHGYKDSILV